MSDVRMSDVFDLPTIVDVELACIRDGKAIDIANFDIKDTGIARTKAAVHAINTHDTMQARIVELEKALESIRSIVTDAQDGFEVAGSDAEILDLINETYRDDE